MIGLVRLFLLEEIRLRGAFSSSLSLILLPQLILMGSLCGYLFSPLLSDSVSYAQIHMAVHAGLFLFGITMGGLAYLGKEFLERSLGPVSMMTSVPEYHPVGEKRMFMAYFLHDLVFFLFLLLIPITFGLAIGSIVRPIGMGRFVLISASQWTTFILGLSVSVLISSILTRRRKSVMVLLPVPLIPLFAAQYYLGDLRAFIIPTASIFHESPMYIFIGFVLAILYVGGGVALHSPNRSSSRQRYDPFITRSVNLLSRFISAENSKTVLISRDLINLIRGRAYVRLLFSLMMPVLVLTALAGVAGGVSDVPVQFNMVFFSVMISFLTVSVYTNLTNMDHLDSDQSLPVRATDLIRLKVLEHVLISLPLGILISVTVAAALNQWSTLLFGIPLMLVAVPYMGMVTAYLTGLWTNSLLFNSSVFLKYMVFTVLPLMSATMLSYMLESFYWPSLIGLGIIILTGSISMLFINKGIDKKWDGAPLFSGRLDI